MKGAIEEDRRIKMKELSTQLYLFLCPFDLLIIVQSLIYDHSLAKFHLIRRFIVFRLRRATPKRGRPAMKNKSQRKAPAPLPPSAAADVAREPFPASYSVA